jgi:hypothetical protein
MAIKHKIKIRKVTGIGVHGLATGDSLDLSDDPKGERRGPASGRESVGRDVPPDEMETVRFEEHDEKDYKQKCDAHFKKEPIWINEDEEYCKHLAKFFKGKSEVE